MIVRAAFLLCRCPGEAGEVVLAFGLDWIGLDWREGKRRRLPEGAE